MTKLCYKPQLAAALFFYIYELPKLNLFIYLFSEWKKSADNS